MSGKNGVEDQKGKKQLSREESPGEGKTSRTPTGGKVIYPKKDGRWREESANPKKREVKKRSIPFLK